MRELWRALERRALDLFQALLRAKARDRTARLSAGSCLLLAPHPDDETLGCGGLAIRRRAAGCEVRVAVAADGAASHRSEPTHVLRGARLAALRRRETLAACRALGVPEEAVTFFDLPDGRLSDVAHELENRIATLLAAARPTDLFVCAAIDGHPDHLALNRAVARLIEKRAMPANVFEYPVWAFDFRSWRAPGRTNKTGFALGVLRMAAFALHARIVALDARSTLEAKRAALRAHRSQLGLLEEEPDWSGLPEEFLERFFTGVELFFPVFEVDREKAEPASRARLAGALS